MDSSIQEVNAKIREASSSLKDLTREIGKVIVGKLWDANCRNRYIDFGSTVDPLFRDKTTRGYHLPDSADKQRTDPVFLIQESGTMVEISVK